MTMYKIGNTFGIESPVKQVWECSVCSNRVKSNERKVEECPTCAVKEHHIREGELNIL